MLYLSIFAIVFLIIFLLYLLSLRPNKGRQTELEPFKSKFIAHRGLFDNADIPENSLPAFAEAIEKGYGIELDVQLTSDDKLVVFHDETLKRMCGDERQLYKLSYDELCKLSLLDTNEKIPLLEDVLSLINGKVPLIVEIKSEGRCFMTAELTNRMLLKYRGVFCIESFHPFILKWFKKNNPRIIRGQLSTDHFKDGSDKPWIVRFILTNLLLNFIAKPDFIAYNHKYKHQSSYCLCRKLYNPVNVAWTIRCQEELDSSKDVFQIFIFDSFIPDKNQ